MIAHQQQSARGHRHGTAMLGGKMFVCVSYEYFVAHCMHAMLA